MTKHAMHQASWYCHFQRNLEKTAMARLETVAMVKMNASVANACTHLNHAEMRVFTDRSDAISRQRTYVE